MERQMVMKIAEMERQNVMKITEMERQNELKITEMERQNEMKIIEMKQALEEKLEEEITPKIENKIRQEFQTKFDSEASQMRSGLESHIESKLEEKQYVIFSAKCTTGKISASTDITYNEVPVNIGNSINPADGVFSAPFKGVYAFSFSAMTAMDTGRIEVRKSNGFEFYIYDENASRDYSNLSYSWIMALEANDKINLRLNNGKLHAYHDFDLYFTGQLLKRIP